MKKYHEWINTGLILVVAILVVVSGNQPVQDFGGSRWPNGISADTTLPVAGQVRGTTLTITGASTLGTSGTALTRVNAGICFFAPDAATIAASSTAEVTCQATAIHEAGIAALTGVNSGDFVQVTLSTTTAREGFVNDGIYLLGATASSTQGFIDLLIFNATGATYTWVVDTAASGTASFISID